PWIITDTFQIMPDHIHAVVWIHYPVDGRAPARAIRRGESHSPSLESHSPSLESHSPLHLNTDGHPIPPSPDNTDDKGNSMASAKNDGHDEGSTVNDRN